MTSEGQLIEQNFEIDVPSVIGVHFQNFTVPTGRGKIKKISFTPQVIYDSNANYLHTKKLTLQINGVSVFIDLNLLKFSEIGSSKQIEYFVDWNEGSIISISVTSEVALALKVVINAIFE